MTNMRCVLLLAACMACTPAPRVTANYCEATTGVPASPPELSSIAGGPRPNPAESLGVVLGVGYLAPQRDDGPPGDNSWLTRIAFPLSPTPDSAPTKWLHQGWLRERGREPRPLAAHDLVEVGYEELAFIVRERRSDGWMQLHLVSHGGEGAWLPPCATRSVDSARMFVRWADVLPKHPLFFRGGADRTVRNAPDADSAASPIDVNHIMSALEVRGEWMRVRVFEPSNYCVDVTPRSREGWIRWYAIDTGPTVWYFTRGC